MPRSVIQRERTRELTLRYVPIHYLDQSMKFPELCALYYRADSMVVTSLRDGMSLVSFESPTNEEGISQHPSHSSSGMNLVSFEYLACQTSKNAKGVLVLSEFAGAAQALGAGALLVNPYNVAEVLTLTLTLTLTPWTTRQPPPSPHPHP